MVMDATVEQIDGYRFVYCLPFARDADVRRGHLLQRHARASTATRWARGSTTMPRRGAGRSSGWRARKPERCRWRWAAISRPIGDRAATKVAKAGVRAGLFHPMTGYSLPDAVRAAALVAGASDCRGAALHALTYGMRERPGAARFLPDARRDAVPGGRARTSATACSSAFIGWTPG